MTDGVYSLNCPECGQTNEVECIGECVVSWVCQYCYSEPHTSLPTDEFGELIEDG